MRSHGLGLCALIALLASSGCSDDAPVDNPDSGVVVPECGFHDECGEGGVCFENKCYGTVTCLERGNCAKVPVCEGQRCICPDDGAYKNRCLPVCESDNDCPTDGECLDGVCERYGASFNGEVPGGGGRQSLEVGIGVVPLDFPMGVSMAGYGARAGKRTPYQQALGGSDSWFDRPDVRAIAFDDGEEMFVLMRIPMGWTTDFMVSETARKVQDATGKNLIDHIITSATHSHSQPARFWYLVQGLYFGSFGYDEFQWEVFDRLTTSFADAIIVALENMQPAKFGYTVLEDWDPDNKIYSDRRQENNGLPGYLSKDDRMVLMRIDDANDVPLAVLTNFGMHGTHFNGTILTNDAPGGVEVVLTKKLQEKYDRPVVGVYIQGNAGDCSPRGDDIHKDELEMIQLIGERTWAKIEPALESIQTSADIPVKVVSGRVAMTHDILYDEGQFYDENVECEGAPDYFRYGAFQCVNISSKLDDDPATKFEDGALGCVFAVECLTNGYPIPQIQKTHLSVAQLGDLGLVTMPGEPLSNFGRDIISRVTDAVTDINAAMIVGYSQDHQFYLMKEEDWLQGGYEPSFGLWGFKLAPYLADQSVELSKELNKAPEERFFDNGNLKPMYWTFPEDVKTTVSFTDTAGDPAEVFVDPGEEVERLQVVRFEWAGGHPGVDLPRITLERENAGSFETVKLPGGWDYDDSGFEMFVRYLGSCNRRNCEDHRWRVDWEEQREFPLGRYRLHAKGMAQKNGQVVEYDALSPAFDLVPARQMRLYDLTQDAGNITGRIVDPAAVEYVQDGDRRVANRIGHRLRSPVIPREYGAPLPESTSLTVSGQLRSPTGQTSALSGAAGSSRVTERRMEVMAYDASNRPELGDVGQRPTTAFTVTSTTFAAGPAGDWVLNLTLTDPAGNSGTVTATITKP